MFLEHLHYKLKIPVSVSSLEMVEIKMEHIVENLLFKILRKKFDIRTIFAGISEIFGRESKSPNPYMLFS